MKEIKLTQGQVALVDDVDYHALSKFKWSARWCPETKSFYAVATVSMGRFILDLKDSKILADHRNHDTLDNRRQNLRPATKSQNMRNRGPSCRSKSGIKGVSWHKQMQKWHAWIRADGKLISLGLHEYLGTAAKMRLRAERKYFGKFAGPLM